MSLNHKAKVRHERRKKRLVLPLIYMLAEVIFVWLVLALIQVNFNIFEWSFWAVGIFIVANIYSISKTVHIYQRQKDYITEEESKD